MNNLRFINRYLEKNRLRLLGIFVVVASYALLNLCSPLIFSFFIDNVINLVPIDNPIIAMWVKQLGGVDYIRSNLWIGGVMVLLVSVLICLCVYLRGKWNGVVSESVSYHLRNHLYDHIQHCPYRYHVGVKTGDLIQRCTSDVDQIRRFLAGQFSEMIYSVFTAILAGLVLFNINQKMALIAIISMPLLIIYAYYFFTRAQKIFLASDESEGEMTAAIQESLSGVRVIKAFNSERSELMKFEIKSQDFKDKTFLLLKQLGMYWGTSDFLCLTQILVVVLCGIFAVRQGSLSVGHYFVFISYEAMILWPIRNLGRLLADMGKMTVSIKRLEEILNEPLEDIEHGSTAPIEGDIEFKDVCFHYDDSDQHVLNHVSFSIEKGQTVALLGPTGSGKSSLVHLLTRLYDCTSGEVLIDGKNIESFQKRHLRENIGLILQEPFLFSKTIYENIQLSNRKASKEAVQRVAQIASVHEVINEFDRGYQTLVGEKGVTLSGGQKQRVAIARTILKETPILIFDDSLSAVDAQTDAEIRQKLKEVQAKTTTIIITQRVASAQSADKILVLENGRITQQGTHEELCKQEGLYKRIVTIQNARMEGVLANESI